MAHPENLSSLWEQAIADENWELAAQLQTERTAQEPLAELSTGAQEQHAILASEFYWFGGIADHGRGPVDGPRDIM